MTEWINQFVAWVESRFDSTATQLTQIPEQLANMALTLQDIQAKEATEQVEVGHVVALLKTLHDDLQQVSADLKTALANNDPTALQAVSDAIDANIKALGDAAAANPAP